VHGCLRIQQACTVVVETRHLSATNTTSPTHVTPDCNPIKARHLINLTRSLLTGFPGLSIFFDDSTLRNG
jgi:hypothetical protein